MLKNKCIFPISGIAVVLACGFACAQENNPKENKHHNHTADAQINQSTTTHDTTTTTSTSSTDQKSDTISKEDITRLSEAFGHFIGRNLKTPGLNFDLESIIKGMRDGYNGKPAPMSDKEYEEMMTKLQEQAFKQLSETNLKAADDFLNNNSTTDHVVEVIPGKLQYIIVEEGTGDTVKEHSAPQIKYTGKFLDGTTFGSSEEVGGSITVPLDQTIPGFSKGIAGMKEGEKRKLFVHPDLGYGTAGQLPPNAMLIFDIEVVKSDTKNAVSQDLDSDDLSPLSLSDDDADEEDDLSEVDDLDTQSSHDSMSEDQN